ncbi:MAG: DUF6883 domain-containing protein [Thermosynechococcaceae cyanobacterium]
MDENSNPNSQLNPSDEWQLGSPLPNAKYVQIDPAKFDQYSMNPDNPRNLGKWKAFEEIGYDISSAENRQATARWIIKQLRQSLPNAPARLGKNSPHGSRFEVRTTIQSPMGKAGTLVTIWQINSGETIPRLITNWLETHRC